MAVTLALLLHNLFHISSWQHSPSYNFPHIISSHFSHKSLKPQHLLPSLSVTNGKEKTTSSLALSIWCLSLPHCVTVIFLCSRSFSSIFSFAISLKTCWSFVSTLRIHECHYFFWFLSCYSIRYMHHASLRIWYSHRTLLLSVGEWYGKVRLWEFFFFFLVSCLNSSSIQEGFGVIKTRRVLLGGLSGLFWPPYRYRY